jgi:hypothetical protein
VQLASDSDGLVCDFGLSSWAETERKTLNLNVPQASADIRAFCNALDEKVKAYVWENRNELFKNPAASKDICDGQYKPLLKHSSKEGFDDMLAAKMRSDAAVFSVRDGNITKEETWDCIDRGCRCVAIVAPARVWFMSGMFGVSLDVHNVLVKPTADASPEALFDLDRLGDLMA